MGHSIIRVLIAFFLLWFGLRLLGKRQMGELTIYNVATIAAVGEMASDLSTDLNANPYTYITALLGFFILSFIMGYISLKLPLARKVLEGTPTIVISNGKILERNLKSLRLSIDNLIEKLREQKVFHLKEVEFAIMEPDGKLSVLLKPLYQTVTAENLHLKTQYKGLPTVLIREGKFEEENLTTLGLTKSWINTQLQAQNITAASDVFLAQIDTAGQLYVDRMEDRG